ncbi:excinuclease ABC subunit UvrC [Motiliproteus coralliicola]|uniref:UvrABC system protein C n=1 Tax=Motiliproteus coralliicola TaxID=2283196 RepID=A0A369WSP5_9GAMM|nr:excinuclease ABC subunit UvrC [Motiliproteus coralliicola]RDE24697.1 excinuclease ABC subunit UvrC [Motiliproteus coralliicola]
MNPTVPTFDSRQFLSHTTQRPGVYQMYDADGAILYVGKAKNLKKRLSSYFRTSGLAVKTQALVQRIASIELTVTGSETEALLLEQNLIKKQRPPYNILLRDDKSYPYIFISNAHQYPAIQFQRGRKRKQGRYFGPFPSGGAVRESLNLLQKIFRIRQCEESFFKNRSRPCLQHQINRCSAPCVEQISPERYAEDIRHAMMFLEGKNRTVNKELAEQMEQAASALEFERAAMLRDQIISLQQVQEQQRISGEGGDADVLACCIKAGYASIHQLFVKGGRVVGSKSHYPKLRLETEPEELLTSFIGQYYLGTDERAVPPLLILSHSLSDQDVLETALSTKADNKICLSHSVRGQRKGWLDLARVNAEQQLDSYISSRQDIYKRLIELQELLELESPPARMECFDISHTFGEATVASCVVFDQQGPRKSDYRRFNIQTTAEGDDYRAMHEALTRRYQKLKSSGALLPELLVIDGGKGQVNQALAVLEELQITEIEVIGIAKGVTRKAGFETLITQRGERERSLDSGSGALHLLQHIRDEAHRFAITGHRARRGKARGRSILEELPGIGPKRRQALLKHFGGLQEIERASVEEIAKVSTISRSMAEEIYSHLHQQ